MFFLFFETDGVHWEKRKTKKGQKELEKSVQNDVEMSGEKCVENLFQHYPLEKIVAKYAQVYTVAKGVE